MMNKYIENGNEYEWKIRDFSNKKESLGTEWAFYVNGILEASYRNIDGHWAVFRHEGSPSSIEIIEVASESWAKETCKRIACKELPIRSKQADVLSLLNNIQVPTQKVGTAWTFPEDE